jgi:hypothetical protein
VIIINCHEVYHAIALIDGEPFVTAFITAVGIHLEEKVGASTVVSGRIVASAGAVVQFCKHSVFYFMGLKSAAKLAPIFDMTKRTPSKPLFFN